jgi:molybdate transport system ATP-binding protein
MLEIDAAQTFGRAKVEIALATPTDGVLALFGPSGAGKTTVLNWLAGLGRPDRGRIRLNGETLFDRAAGIDLPPERRRVAYMFQDLRLFPHLNVRDNIRYGWRRAKAGERHIQEDAILDLLELRPLLARRIGDLSGGEKQRVALARALLSAPKLLLLDEPLSALDDKRKAEILPFLERVRSTLTIPTVLVSHNVDEVVRLANRVAVIAEGKLRKLGTVYEVFADLGLGDILDTAAGAAIPARVSVPDDGSGLSVLDFAGGQFRVPGAGRPAGTALNLRVRARDVALAKRRVDGISILNQFEGRITEIAQGPHNGQGPYADVLLDIGVPIWARISQHSLRDLGLSVGMRAWCLVKAVSFDTDSR